MNDQLREWKEKAQESSQKYPEADNLPAVREDARASARSVVPVALGGDSREILTNLDILTEEGQAAAINALGSADKNASEVLGQELRVKAAVCGAADWRDHDGEITTGPAVTLILEDGSTVFVSGHLACRAIGQLVLFARGREWNPPKRIVIEAEKGKQPQPYHVIKVLLTGVVKTQKKGGKE